jgi:hypothetical protein
VQRFVWPGPLLEQFARQRNLSCSLLRFLSTQKVLSERLKNRADIQATAMVQRLYAWLASAKPNLEDTCSGV